MIEIIKNISSVLGLIATLLTILGVIIKPIRRSVVRWIRNTTSSSELEKMVQDNNNMLEILKGKIDQNTMNRKNDNTEILSQIQTLNEKVEKLDKRVFENERDRIKSELSEYASRCTRGMKIYPEQMFHINEIYAKYHDEMHCNSSGEINYKEIIRYYENQDWIKS